MKRPIVNDRLVINGSKLGFFFFLQPPQFDFRKSSPRAGQHAAGGNRERCHRPPLRPAMAGRHSQPRECPSICLGFWPIWTRCCETLRGLLGCGSCDRGLVVPYRSHGFARPGAPCSHSGFRSGFRLRSATMLSNFNTRDLFNHFFCETAKGNPGLW